MVALGAKLDQLHKISGRLSSQVTFPNSGERIAKDDLGESMKSRFATPRDLNLRLVEQIEFTRKRTFVPACSLRHSLNTAQGLRTPRNNHARIAKLALPQKNGRGALHPTNLIGKSSTANGRECTRIGK